MPINFQPYNPNQIVQSNLLAAQLAAQQQALQQREAQAVMQQQEFAQQQARAPIEQALNDQLRQLQAQALTQKLGEEQKPFAQQMEELFARNVIEKGLYGEAPVVEPSLLAQQGALGESAGFPSGTLQAPGIVEALAESLKPKPITVPGLPPGQVVNLNAPTERALKIAGARQTQALPGFQVIEDEFGNRRMVQVRGAGAGTGVATEITTPTGDIVKAPPKAAGRGRSVLAVDPKGKLTNIVLGAGESLPDGFKEKVRGGDAASLRKEFNLLKEVKSFKELDRQVGLMRTAFDQLGKGGGKGPVDQALITTYNKILDPDSVVRESEYARTPEGVALLNRLKGKIQQFTEGGVPFTDADRADLLNTANALFDTAQESYDGTKDFYTTIAMESGIDPNLVVRDQKAPSNSQPSTTAAPSAQGSITIKSIRRKQ